MTDEEEEMFNADAIFNSSYTGYLWDMNFIRYQFE